MKVLTPSTVVPDQNHHQHEQHDEKDEGPTEERSTQVGGRVLDCAAEGHPPLSNTS